MENTTISSLAVGIVLLGILLGTKQIYKKHKYLFFFSELIVSILLFAIGIYNAITKNNFIAGILVLIIAVTQLVQSIISFFYPNDYEKEIITLKEEVNELKNQINKLEKLINIKHKGNEEQSVKESLSKKTNNFFLLIL